MVYFQVVKSEELLNSPVNKRQEAVAEEIQRGSILARDGVTELAATRWDENGNETRVYPYGSLFAQTVGYSAYGGSGLEASKNAALLQSNASIMNQVQKELYEEKKPGDNLVTTLDVSLQQAAADALTGQSGAVVVMDADTGKVLVDYSSPAYDPNTVTEDWDYLTQNDNGIFLNRVMQGLYPPGSTFKVITALAYLRTYGTFDNFEYTCEGTHTESDFTIHCYGYYAHGYENFESAVANSCNCAFAYMATHLIDKDVLRETAESFGFNADLDTDLSATTSEFHLDKNTPDQLTMQTAIGQGDTLATPIQMCLVADAVANGGKMMRPMFVDRIVSADGKYENEAEPEVMREVMNASEAENLQKVMKAVVQWGTAADLADLPYDIAGKTGTAEYGNIEDGTAHSWFIGFSNTGREDIVIAVIIEGGGNGIAPATQAARTVFQTWFGNGQ
ncbi:MAG: penicillin-binding transpeptidase domain-containing protein [Eubacteriales bacterium]|nr:penicillin-binding transpeptidase domain-containing protein [Eubacteriales bacterium]